MSVHLTILALILFPIAGLVSGANAQGHESYLVFLERFMDRDVAPLWSAGTSSRTAEATPAVNGLLIDKHTAAGVLCESCHAKGEAEPREQHPPVPIPSFDATCVACHGTMLDDSEGKEMSFPNPHMSPHLAPGEVPQCTECHRVHAPGEVTCNLCHRGFNFTID
jgi:hypothetical protein